MPSGEAVALRYGVLDAAVCKKKRYALPVELSGTILSGSSTKPGYHCSSADHEQMWVFCADLNCV